MIQCTLAATNYNTYTSTPLGDGFKSKYNMTEMFTSEGLRKMATQLFHVFHLHSLLLVYATVSSKWGCRESPSHH